MKGLEVTVWRVMTCLLSFRKGSGAVFKKKKKKKKAAQHADAHTQLPACLLLLHPFSPQLVPLYRAQYPEV